MAESEREDDHEGCVGGPCGPCSHCLLAHPSILSVRPSLLGKIGRLTIFPPPPDTLGCHAQRRNQPMDKTEMYKKGTAMRRELMGEAMADRMATTVYSDKLTEGFADWTREAVFG